MSATASTLISAPGTEGPKVFTASAAPTVDNDLTTGANPGDHWIVAGTATNAVQSLLFVDSTGSGTFTLTCEGITTGAITYSATAATLVTNINTALNAAFGTSQLVASGATLAAIIVTFSGSNFAARPVGAITAAVGSLSQATLTITTTTVAGVAGAAVYVMSVATLGAAVWNRIARVIGATLVELIDATGGTAAGTVAAITAGSSYAQADLVAIKNGLASTIAKLNAVIGILKADAVAA